MKQKKGFTLIELLAVIVILAIIAIIATPIVLNIINDTKKNAQKATINNIIHAAELYYSKSQMTGKGLEQITFDLKDEKSGLEFDGERPNGTITIYKDGSILINSRFEDGSTYIKLPNEDTLSSEDKSVGSYENWQTNGNGVITKYLSKEDKAKLGTANFLDYLLFAYEYGITDKTDSKSLPDLIKEKEQSGEFSKLYLTDALKHEIDAVINDMNVPGALTPSEIQSLVVVYQTAAPNVLDVFLNKDTHKEKYEEYVAYQEIYNSLPEYLHESGYLVIPNYVKQKDGTLEPITILSTSTFFEDTHNTKCALAIFEGDYSTLKGGVNVVISEGIKTLEAASFQACALNSVNFPSTLETIELSVFVLNKLNKIFLPSSLKVIGDTAFEYSGIKGSLTIPKDVKTIGQAAFAFDEYNFIEFNNNITELIFEEGSVIETIGESAFSDNYFEELVIPPSIKTIGISAFSTKTLKSVIIEKAQGDNLFMGRDAFGSATIEYRPRQD